MFYDWKPYVSVADRQRRAKQALARALRQGTQRSPVMIEGRTIATTFWGKAWCDNIERYSDFYNRLERGRSYIRSGAVLDLQITPGVVRASVMGSRLYSVKVKIAAVPHARWSAVCKSSSGAIDSLVELLQGRFSKSVMEHICRKETGLFPAPKEITFTCSCPDWASMCKHVAAVLYGIGARFDTRPELLFTLRKVDHNELIAKAASDLVLNGAAPAPGKRLKDDALSELFGVEMCEAVELPIAKGSTKPKPAATATGTRKKKKPAGKAVDRQASGGARSRPATKTRTR